MGIAATSRKSTFSSQLTLCVCLCVCVCVCVYFEAKWTLYQTSILNHKEKQGEAFASLPKIRHLLHCAENLIRQSETIGTGSYPEQERKLTLPATAGPKVMFNCVLIRQLFPELDRECVSS